jgi:VCBS repeat protein
LKVSTVVLAAGLVVALASPANAAANSLPIAPKVFTAYPSYCGTADKPTMFASNLRSGFATLPYDPDGDLVISRLEIHRADGSLIHSAEIGPTGSESKVAFPPVPDGVLTHGQTYYYRGNTRDSEGAGPYSTPCYFTMDTVRPGKVTIESTDFPDTEGEPGPTPARTTGTITIRKAPGDTDVTEFRYGFTNVDMSKRIIPGPDGSAVLPVTLPGNGFARLYVMAADAAGNLGPLLSSWDLTPGDNPAPQAHVKGDLTGDGRADVTTVLDYGFDHTMVWNVTARQDGFHTGTEILDAGVGSYPADRTGFVRGDFNGDGRADFVLMQENSNGGARLVTHLSDGNALRGGSVAWDSGSELLRVRDIRMLAGDFNGDGKSDVAVQNATTIRVFLGGAMGSPTSWLTSTQNRALVTGDFDGDGRADLAQLKDLGSGRADLVVHHSTGTAFEAGVVKWEGDYGVAKGKLVAADVNQDGRDDIVSMYDNGGSDTSLLVFNGGSNAPQEWWRRTGEFEASRSALSTGDFDLDGKADLAVVANNGPSTQLWTLRSTGTSFAGRVLGWDQVTGGVPLTSVS